MDATNTEAIIVEKIRRRRGYPPMEVLHLSIPSLAFDAKTLCGRTFDGLTMIPLSSWGNPDYAWCEVCKGAYDTDNEQVIAKRIRRTGVDRCGGKSLASPRPLDQE